MLSNNLGTLELDRPIDRKTKSVHFSGKKLALRDFNEMMDCSNATSSDELVIIHFCKQIFHVLGHPDKETAILKKKWRVAVRPVSAPGQLCTSTLCFVL